MTTSRRSALPFNPDQSEVNAIVAMAVAGDADPVAVEQMLAATLEDRTQVQATLAVIRAVAAGAQNRITAGITAAALSAMNAASGPDGQGNLTRRQRRRGAHQAAPRRTAQRLSADARWTSATSWTSAAASAPPTAGADAAR